MSEAHAYEAAVIGILAAVARADGRVADEELAWWQRLRSRHPLFRDLPPSVLNPLHARALEALADQPWADAVTDWARQVPRAEAETIYRLAVELQFADGESSRQESRVTVHLAHALGLSAERSTHIFETALHARLGD